MRWLDENSIESTTSTIKGDLESPISIRYLEQSSTLSLQQLPASSMQTSTKNSTITIINSNNASEDDYVCHDGPILAGTNKLIFFILIFFLNLLFKCLKCLIGYKMKTVIVVFDFGTLRLLFSLHVDKFTAISETFAK